MKETSHFNLRMLAVLVVVALLIVFIVENNQTVHIRLIVPKLALSMAWALLLAAGLGFVAGLVSSRLRH